MSAIATEIDINSLTIDELDLVEEVTGAPLEDVMAGKARATKVLRAFALVALRRDNPEATLADAGKVDVSGLGELLGQRPTEAAEPPATAPSASSPKPRASRSSGSQR